MVKNMLMPILYFTGQQYAQADKLQFSQIEGLAHRLGLGGVKNHILEQTQFRKMEIRTKTLPLKD